MSDRWTSPVLSNHLDSWVRESIKACIDYWLSKRSLSRGCRLEIMQAACYQKVGVSTLIRRSKETLTSSAWVRRWSLLVDLRSNHDLPLGSDRKKWWKWISLVGRHSCTDTLFHEEDTRSDGGSGSRSKGGSRLVLLSWAIEFYGWAQLDKVMSSVELVLLCTTVTHYLLLW